MTAAQEEGEAILTTATQLGTYATLVMQAGLVLGNALVACPTSGGGYHDLDGFLRQWLPAPEGDDATIPVIAITYMARAISDDRIMDQKQPQFEEVIAIIERWVMGAPAVGINRDFAQLRVQLGKAVGLCKNDIDSMTATMHELKGRLEAARNA